MTQESQPNPTDTTPAPTTESAPAPAVEPAAPTAASIQEAKLEALRLKNAERKARVAEQAERAKALDAREAAIKSWDENPLDGLRALGTDPKKALEALVREAELDGTPAGEVAKLRREFAAEMAKRDAELATLRAAEEARKAEAQERANAARAAEAQAAFIAIPEVAALRGRWTDAELVQLGNHYADALSAGGRRVTMQQIAEAVSAECEKLAARFAPAPQTAAPAPRRVTNGGRPNTLSTTGLEAAAKRPLSWHEAVARAKRRPA